MTPNQLIQFENMYQDIKALFSRTDDLRKYHEALGTKLASLERQLDPEHEDDIYDAVADKRADGMLRTPTLERQPVPKKWEIVEFFSPDLNRVHCTLNKKTGGYYSDAVESDFTLSHMLGEIKSKEVTIHAVRRLHDDTTWRVGQTVSYKTYPKLTGVIRLFKFSYDELYAEFTDTTGDKCVIAIGNLLLPQPLFVTADGVPRYSGEKVCCWSTLTGPGEMVEAQDWMKPEHFYSTRAAAEAAYDKWLFEQPVLTLSDIKADVNWITLQKLTDFVKEKMGKK